MRKKRIIKQQQYKHIGFTLAEVLITLAIIGIVAAITIPTLIQNYKKKETITRLKKFYSTMLQATRMAEAEYGPVKTWGTFKEPYDSSNADSMQKINEDAYEFWNKYMSKYVKTLKITKGEYNEETGMNLDSLTKLYFPDGTTAAITGDGKAFEIYYDVNGDKGPNTLGRDRFDFLMENARTRYYHELKEGSSFDVGWLPAYNYNVVSRDNLLQRCSKNAVYCTTLLYLDNWEFKYDYPYKL